MIFQFEVLLLESLFNPLGLRHVSGDFGEPLQEAIFVEDGGDHDAGPKLLSVLSYSPALPFRATFCYAFLSCSSGSAFAMASGG